MATTPKLGSNTSYKDKFNQAMSDMLAAQQAGQTADEYYAQKQAEEEAAKKAEEERVAAENREKSERAWTTAVSSYAEKQGIDPNTLIDYLKSTGEWESYIDSFNDADGGLGNYISKLQEAANKLEKDRESGTTAVEEARRWEDEGKPAGTPETIETANAPTEQLQDENAASGSSQLSQEQANAINETTASNSQATSDAMDASTATAKGIQTSAINAGLSKSKAGMLGANQGTSETADNATNLYASNASQKASTQADYLQQMAQANAADLQASNLNKAAGLAGISGALQGAGSGASMGATISDERCKEEPFDDNKLFEAIEEFKKLKARLDELKKERK